MLVIFGSIPEYQRRGKSGRPTTRATAPVVNGERSRPPARERDREPTSPTNNSPLCRTLGQTRVFDLYATQGPNGGATADLEPKVPRDALPPALRQACDDACRHEKSNKSLITDVVVAVVFRWVFGVVVGIRWRKRKKRAQGAHKIVVAPESYELS
ncbi:hypothetical protein BGZ82_003856 [Podila clonocystis]|nr:hypothetical protein BGZ82_003856 [Podila clonocystis]